MGRANVVDIFRAVMPFILTIMFVLMPVTYLPEPTLMPGVVAGAMIKEKVAS